MENGILNIMLLEKDWKINFNVNLWLITEKLSTGFPRRLGFVRFV